MRGGFRRCGSRNGSFAQWLAAHHPRSPETWTQLFRRTFRFTGGQIVGEFLMSIGYLPGGPRARLPGLCPYSRMLAAMGERQSTLTRILNELVRGLSQAPVSLGRPWRILDRAKRRGT
jgi:hypothetical protein